MPHSAQAAEGAVIATCLVYPASVEVVAGVLKPEAFEGYRSIYRAIFDRHRRGEPVDLALLASDGISPSLLSGIIEEASPNLGMLDAYCTEVRRSAMRRDATEVFETAIQRVKGPDDIEDIVQQSVESLQRCYTSQSIARHISEAVKDWATDTAARMTGSDVDALAIATGSQRVNEHLTLGGLACGHMTVIGGQSGGGKTALAISLLAVPAALSGQGVLLCSLEDNDVSVACRAIADLANLPNKMLQRHKLDSPGEYKDACAAGQRLAGTNLYVIDQPPESVDSLVSQITRHCSENSTQLVVIDFLQYIDSGKSGGNATEKEDYTLRQLAMMSRRLKDTATVVLTQYRALDEDAKPTNNDIRGSKVARHFAHTILHIWHDPTHKDRANPCYVTIVFGKQKQGPVGEVIVGYEPSRVRFSDV